MRHLLLLVLQCARPAPAAAQNVTVQSFSRAKKHLVEVFEAAPVTVYSRCRYDAGAVDYASCPYQPLKQNSRAARIEWEHVVPAEAFGRSFAAWRDGHPRCIDLHGKPFRGRQCAAKVDTRYRQIEADMYNLFAEVGELNARRGNLTMEAVVDGKDVINTGCGKIARRSFEPPDAVKGTVARVHLYMNDAYPSLRLLSAHRCKLFVAWDTQHPPDAQECARGRRIAARQGNINRFIARSCPLCVDKCRLRIVD